MSPPVCSAFLGVCALPPLSPLPPNARGSTLSWAETSLPSPPPAFVDLPELLLHLDGNFKYWKDLDERKLRSLRPPAESEWCVTVTSLSSVPWPFC